MHQGSLKTAVITRHHVLEEQNHTMPYHVAEAENHAEYRVAQSVLVTTLWAG